MKNITKLKDGKLVNGNRSPDIDNKEYDVNNLFYCGK